MSGAELIEAGHAATISLGRDELGPIFALEKRAGKQSVELTRFVTMPLAVVIFVAPHADGTFAATEGEVYFESFLSGLGGSVSFGGAAVASVVAGQ